MSVYFDFGGQTFRAGSVGASISTTPELADNGEPWLETVRWDLELRIIKTPSLTVKAQTETLKSVFSQTRAYAKFTDGTTDSAESLTDNILGGVRVVGGPSYAMNSGGEGVNFRTVTVSLEAVVRRYTSATQVVKYSMQNPQVEAGPTIAALQPNVGPSTIQRTRTQQYSTYSQSGSVTFAAAYGNVPRPQFPADIQVGPVQLTPRNPRTIGGGIYRAEVGFTVDFAYQFIAPSSLRGLPTRWLP